MGPGTGAMDDHPFGGVVRHIRRMAGAAAARPSEDRQLLEQFVSRHDQGAFTALVERHGPMVLGVCRRVLRDPHDADDAFQAAFLVLLRKAGSLRDRDLLAGWLYGVAYRTALKARARRARRRAHEKQADSQPLTEAADGTAGELRAVLDEEVRRLPEKYRLPVLLCYLQGATLTEAARELGWPAGTVSGRLARARDLLRGRLTRRGIVLTAAAAEATLSRPAPAAVPASLIERTVRGAVALASGRGLSGVPAPVAALMKGVLNAMFLTKIKVAVLVVLTVGLAAGGTWAVVHPRLAAQQPGPQRLDPPRAEPGPPAAVEPQPPDVVFPPRPDALSEARVKELADAAKVSDKQKVLLKELHRAAREEMDARWQEFLAGRGTLDIMLGASLRLLEAERELSDKKADQVTALENHWRRMREMEKVDQAQFQAGRLAEADWAQSRFYRIQAELWLEKAREK